EGAGDLKVLADDYEVVDTLEDFGHHRAGHAVGGIDEDADASPERPQEPEHVGAVGVPQVAFLVAAGGGDGVRAFGGVQALGDGLDVLEAGLGPDGFGVHAGNLEPVVLYGVMAGGGLDAA